MLWLFDRFLRSSTHESTRMYMPGPGKPSQPYIVMTTLLTNLCKFIFSF